MSSSTSWGRLPPWARWVSGIAAGVVLLNLALTLLGDLYGAPGGKQSSSYATGPEGTAAVSELLARRGHPVAALRGPLTEALPETGVLVVLDPETMAEEEVAALRRWVESGGSLVIGGSPYLWSDELLQATIEWSPAGTVEAEQIAAVPETASIRSIAGEGFGAWEDSSGALPVLGVEGSPARTVVSVATIGRGRAVLLADASVLHNRYLAEADNAAFALNLAGPPGTPVHFAEGVHGYGNGTGLMAIPFRWKVALIGLALASIAWMVAVGRRVGPPEPEARDLAPPRRAYVDALATTLGRTKQTDEVVAPVRAAVRARIARQTGLDERSDDVVLERAGRGLGLNETELAAVFGRGGDPVIAGRALVKLGGRSW